MGETFTEFYVLGIVNHEAREARYTVQIRAGEDLLRTLGPVALAHEQKWEDRVTFSPRRTGERVKVEFLLYIDGGTVPYRSLHLWLIVLPP